MKRSSTLALTSIFFVALFMRLLPFFKFTLWGADTGEYYFLTNELITNNFISYSYNGWGIAYPYFPGMYVLSASARFICNFDLISSLLLIAPIVSSLSVFPFFLMVRKLFKDDRIALLSSLFLSIAMPHVYPTSHPAPCAIAHFLLIFCLLLLLKSYENRYFFFPLILSSLALVATHHLTVYFLFLCVTFAFFLREVLKEKSDVRMKIDFFYILFLLTTMMVYWTFIAVPFKQMLDNAFSISSWLLFFFAYISLLFIILIVKVRRRLQWKYSPLFPTKNSQIAKFFLLLGVGLTILFYIGFYTTPGTNIKVNAAVIPLFAPLIILISFSTCGSSFTQFYKNGVSINAWLWAIIISLFAGIAMNSHTLIPYRHMEYLMIPLAVLVGLGIVLLLNIWLSSKKKAVSMAIILILFSLSTFSAYPEKNIMGGFQEGTIDEEMSTISWVKYSVKTAKNTISTDHRMSSLLFGFTGINATWDASPNTLYGETFAEAEEEMRTCYTPSGIKQIDYVLINEDIKQGAMLLVWENAEPLSDKAIKKFDDMPFIKTFDNGDGQIYMVDWNSVE